MTIVDAPLAFARAVDVTADHERPGLLRTRTLGTDEPDGGLDFQPCRIRDWSSGAAPSLFEQGFTCADLSTQTELQAVLERVRETGELPDADSQAIRRLLSGQSLQLADGSRIRVLFIAPEGFILRLAGPNGLSVGPPGHIHDAATAIHADQDIGGTPLRQMMRGAAPLLFRHDAPDSRNGWSPLLLLNLWIPLQQITRPLVLMDKRTLDRRAHQLRYGLPTDDFLDREEERSVNDIWAFLHHEGQQWYFHPELRSDRAYLFETLGTPHGSFIIPGEECAEAGYRMLDAASDSIRRRDAPALRRAVESTEEPPRAVTTIALRSAVDAMHGLIEEARKNSEELCHGHGAEDWQARASASMDAVVRKSVEMRVVALRIPRRRRG